MLGTVDKSNVTKKKSWVSQNCGTQFFQFPPLREGRRQETPVTTLSTHFNSRPCERGDNASGRYRLPQPNFNSRPCERGDFRKTAYGSFTILFQFSPLREGRPPIRSFPVPLKHFNSRPCERGDSFFAASALQCPIFQFSPLREGRPSESCETCWAWLFQFSPLREGRPAVLHSGGGRVSISILAPARGATNQKVGGRRSVHISILAPARGATRKALFPKAS